MPLPKKVIREAHRLAERMEKHRDHIKEPHALAMAQTKRKHGYDPGKPKPPKPNDYWIAENAMLRLVPTVAGLMEIAIYVDKGTFERIVRQLGMLGEPNLEIGSREIIRRGRSNPATNIFIYSRER